MSYEDFLAGKLALAPPEGISGEVEVNEALFPFQREIVRWALRRGRCAVFAACGLGKTLVSLEWAKHVMAHAGGRVLILAPLAVAQQTVREAERFKYAAAYARNEDESGDGTVVTNYERLDGFDLGAYSGVVLDESSILKSFMGSRKRALIEACRETPFRLCCSATPAPNDHVELGNHAEFLGVMESHKMLSRWFINDTSTFGTYRLKGHAIVPFWDWVASWAVCIDKPSEMGYSDEGFTLPPLELHQHILDVDVIEGRMDTLFRMPDLSATSIHREKRRTAADRAAKVAELVAAEPSEQWLIWCETDYEAKELRAVIPEAFEVRGPQSLAVKVQAAFDFLDGTTRVLLSKARIFGWGMNFQNCARVAFVGATFSYESFYQAVRRCWRFGQKRPVDVHVVMAQTERSIWGTLTQKRDGHDTMRKEMSAAMMRARAKEAAQNSYLPNVEMVIPSWLKSEEAA